jgi:hypothetical protein
MTQHDEFNLDCSSMRSLGDSDLRLRGLMNEQRARIGLPPIPIYPAHEDNGQRLRRTDKVSESMNKTGIEATLDERGARYGSYAEKAAIIQQMKESMRAGSSWAGMAPDMKESLEMVVSKVGRIVTGDADYSDSWHDIIGYTKLVEDRLKGVVR